MLASLTDRKVPDGGDARTLSPQDAGTDVEVVDLTPREPAEPLSLKAAPLADAAAAAAAQPETARKVGIVEEGDGEISAGAPKGQHLSLHLVSSFLSASDFQKIRQF